MMITVLEGVRDALERGALQHVDELVQFRELVNVLYVI